MRSERPRPCQAEITVVLPPPLLRLFPASKMRVRLRASNVAEILDQLDALWPGMADRLRDSTPHIRRHINIFVEGRRATLETRLKDGCEVYILTAMSGG